MNDSKRKHKTVIRLDLINACLWYGKQRIIVKPKDFSVLRYLAEHAGQLVTKAELFDAVWLGVVVTETVLKACINRLRQALGDQARTPQFIETVHRRGYRFIAPIMITTQPVPGSEFRIPVVQERNNAEQSGARNVKPDTYLVGRESELAHLHQWLVKALGGERQVVFVTGEAGLGKTTLVDAFLKSLESRVWSPEPKTSREGFPVVQTSDSRHQTQDSRFWVGRGQCIDHYGGSEPYMPILEVLGRLARGPEQQTIVSCLTQHAPTWLVQLPGLLSDRDLAVLQRRTVGATRERMLRELAEALEVLTAEQPLILLLEDLQWSDVSTLNLLAAVARRREPARLLMLGTYRPADLVQRDHPFPLVMQELHMHRLCSELRLGLLSETHIAAYLPLRFGGRTIHKPLQQELARVIYQRTKGHPLFIAMMLENWLAQKLLVKEKRGWTVHGALATLQTTVPMDLRRMIEVQLERLTTEERKVLEAGSVVGLDFSAAAAAAGVDTEVGQVEAVCAGLVRRSLFLRSGGEQRWPDGTITGSYVFTHELYQEMIYNQIPTTQRVNLHRRIGKREEEGYRVQAGPSVPRLAIHFERGGDYPRAVHYHQQAAQNAIRRSGYQEALTHAAAGLTLLEYLPDTAQRTEYALMLHHLQGLSLAASKGTAAVEVEQAYARAHTLTQHVKETHLIFPILLGLWNFYTLRGVQKTAHPLAEQLLRLARKTPEKSRLLEAHLSSGMGMLYRGEMVTARAHLEKCLTLYDVQGDPSRISIYGADPRVVVHGHAAWTLWFLGYPAQAMRQSQAALTQAHQLAHPFSLTFALAFTAALYQLRQEIDLAYEHAQVTMTMATDHGFAPWSAMGTVLYGWALVLQGHRRKGVIRMQQGVQAWHGTGAEVGRLHWLTLLAEAYEQLGQIEEGLRTLDDALRIGTITGERMYEAEVYRLKGELLLMQEGKKQGARRQEQGKKMETVPRSLNPGEAEACFHKAIEIARQQQAKSWELRATTSLARLCVQKGKQREARNLMSGIYYWFTEGFDTKDLQEAKKLLEELAR